MAPKKKTAAAAAATMATMPAEVPEEVVVEEIVEEIVPVREEPASVTFVLGNAGGIHGEEMMQEGDVDEEDDMDDEDEDDDEDELFTAVAQLTQLMMTEEGEAVADVLHGIRDALDKQNKILYRGLQLLEAKARR